MPPIDLSLLDIEKKHPLLLGRLSMIKAICFGKVIDVGCGLGETFGEKATNLDIESEEEKINLIHDAYPDNYKRFKKRFPDLRIPNYIQADASERIPFGDKEFDCAVLSEVLEHIELDKCVSILKECGRVADFVAVSVPNEWEWPEPIAFNKSVEHEHSKHINFFKKEDLYDIVNKTGMRVIYYLKLNMSNFSHHILVATNERILPIFNMEGKQIIGFPEGGCVDEIISCFPAKKGIHLRD